MILFHISTKTAVHGCLQPCHLCVRHKMCAGTCQVELLGPSTASGSNCKILHGKDDVRQWLRWRLLQVRCRRTRDEADLTVAQVRTAEAEFFCTSPDFGASPSCPTGVPALVEKLESLQWKVYKRLLPSPPSQVLSWYIGTA